MEETKKKEKKPEGRFSAKRIAKIAVFAALAYAISWIEIPIMSATPLAFMKLDLANVFIMLAGFMFGPVEGIIVSLVKELLRLITSTTGGVGELANFLVAVSYITVPAVCYRFKKGVPTVIVTLLIGCLLQIGAGYLTNYFINFPFFMGKEVGQAMCSQYWYFIVMFNAIKSVAVSIITLLLYKRLKWLIDKI